MWEKTDFPFKMLLYKRMSLDNDNKIKEKVFPKIWKTSMFVLRINSEQVGDMSYILQALGRILA